MFQEPTDEKIASSAATKLDARAQTTRSAIRRQPTVRPHRRELISARESDTDLHIAGLEAELERLRRSRVRQRSRRPRGSEHRERERDAPSDWDGLLVRAENPDTALPRVRNESNLRWSMGSISPRGMLSPPQSSGSGSQEPALTPGFAPARGPYTEDMPTPPPESWEGSYPPLRRVGRARQWYEVGRPGERINGLGDRRRSPGPEEEEETWANLLTTMEDGSAPTSFNSDRARPSQLTTSFGEIGQADDTCDLDLAPGITEEDVRAIREHHRRTEPDGPVMTGERGLREHTARRGERRFRRTELGMFQSILERMQRREEIPDDWWAAVGLTPDVVRSGQS
jgi:hypothetical protein